jgi:hypothetical protein
LMTAAPSRSSTSSPLSTVAAVFSGTDERAGELHDARTEPARIATTAAAPAVRWRQELLRRMFIMFLPARSEVC